MQEYCILVNYTDDMAECMVSDVKLLLMTVAVPEAAKEIRLRMTKHRENRKTLPFKIADLQISKSPNRSNKKSGEAL